MFYSCQALTEVDLSNWDMSKITHAQYVFYACRGLKTIKFPKEKTPLRHHGRTCTCGNNRGGDDSMALGFEQTPHLVASTGTHSR